MHTNSNGVATRTEAFRNRAILALGVSSFICALLTAAVGLGHGEPPPHSNSRLIANLPQLDIYEEDGASWLADWIIKDPDTPQVHSLKLEVVISNQMEDPGTSDSRALKVRILSEGYASQHEFKSQRSLRIEARIPHPKFWLVAEEDGGRRTVPIQLRAPFPSVVHLELGKPGGMEGAVICQDSPISDLTICAVPIGTPFSWEDARSAIDQQSIVPRAISDLNGKFSFDGMVGGQTYLLYAGGNGYVATEPALATAGTNTPITIQVFRARTSIVRLVSRYPRNLRSTLDTPIPDGVLRLSPGNSHGACGLLSANEPQVQFLNIPRTLFPIDALHANVFICYLSGNAPQPCSVEYAIRMPFDGSYRMTVPFRQTSSEIAFYKVEIPENTEKKTSLRISLDGASSRCESNSRLREAPHGESVGSICIRPLDADVTGVRRAVNDPFEPSVIERVPFGRYESWFEHRSGLYRSAPVTFEIHEGADLKDVVLPMPGVSLVNSVTFNAPAEARGKTGEIIASRLHLKSLAGDKLISHASWDFRSWSVTVPYLPKGTYQISADILRRGSHMGQVEGRISGPIAASAKHAAPSRRNGEHVQIIIDATTSIVELPMELFL